MSRSKRHDEWKGRGRRPSRDSYDNGSDGEQVERRGYQRGGSIDPKPTGFFQGFVGSLFGTNPNTPKVQKLDSDSDKPQSSSALELKLRELTAEVGAQVEQVERLRDMIKQRRLDECASDEKRRDDRNPRKDARSERDHRKPDRHERDLRKDARSERESEEKRHDDRNPRKDVYRYERDFRYDSRRQFSDDDSSSDGSFSEVEDGEDLPRPFLTKKHGQSDKAYGKLKKDANQYDSDGYEYPLHRDSSGKKRSLDTKQSLGKRDKTEHPTDVPASSSSSSSSLPVKPGPDADTVEKFKVFLRTLHPENLNSLLESAQNKTDMDFSFLDTDRETAVRTLFGQLTRKQMVAAMQEIAFEFLVAGKRSGKPKSTGGTKAKAPTAQPVAKVVPKACKKQSAKANPIEKDTDIVHVEETYTDPAGWLRTEVNLMDEYNAFKKVMTNILKTVENNQKDVKGGVKIGVYEITIFDEYAKSQQTVAKYIAKKGYTLDSIFPRKFCVGVMLAGFQHAIGMKVPSGCKENTNTVRSDVRNVETWKLVSKPLSRIEASKRVAKGLLDKQGCPESEECVSYLFKPWNQDDSDAEIDHSSDKKGVAKHSWKKGKQERGDGHDGNLEHVTVKRGTTVERGTTRRSVSPSEDDGSNCD